MPPRMLKRPSLRETEGERKAGSATAQRAAARRRAPSATQNTGACCAGALLAAARPDATARSPRRCRPASAISDRSRSPAANTGRGRNRPRLLRKPPPGSAMLSRSSGSALSTALYQNSSCSSSGMLRMSLDIAAGDPRHQPVLRQPRDADDEAEDGREHDAERGDQQRVEQADPERAADRSRRRRIGDQRLADVEAGGVVPEAEAGGDLGAREILARVVRSRRTGEERRSRAHEHRPDTAMPRDLRIVDAAAACGRRAASTAAMRPRASASQAGRSAQRTGGAYCRPPLVHSALRPRAIFSGEPWPTLRSNTSP